MVNTSFYFFYRNTLINFMGNIDYRTQIEMTNFIQVQALFVFAAISEF